MQGLRVLLQKFTGLGAAAKAVGSWLWGSEHLPEGPGRLGPQIQEEPLMLEFARSKFVDNVGGLYLHSK